VSCLLGEGRSILPSPFEVMWNSLVEFPILARSEDGSPSRVEPMTTAGESSPMVERLRPPKQSTMNLRLLKRMVSPREKTSHDGNSPLAATMSADDGTIETSRGKVHCKSPFLVHQLSVFSTLPRTGWLRSCVPILRWSCELQSTL
jgi:hypothetical protein